MNYDKLNEVIDNYIEQFSFTSNEENNELYKWHAAAVWKKNWNLDSDDFTEMFRKSISEASNIIDNRFVQPASGIVQLCTVNNGKYKDRVKQQFKLLMNADGEVDKKQASIEAFIEAINGMIGEAYKGSWRYPQDIKSVSNYLGMNNPSEEYFFKSSVVHNFADYVEFGDDIGAGKSFSLKHYYRLCDQIAEGIRQREDLLSLMQKALSEKAKAVGVPEVETVDPEYHLLVFNIMYCTNEYGFYSTHPIVRIRRKPKSLNEVKAQKRIECQEMIDKYETDAAKLLESLPYPDYPDRRGCEINHITYGKGIIKEQENNFIIVGFDDVTKKLDLSTLIRLHLILEPDQELVDVTTQRTEYKATVDKKGIELSKLRIDLMRI